MALILKRVVCSTRFPCGIYSYGTNQQFFILCIYLYVCVFFPLSTAFVSHSSRYFHIASPLSFWAENSRFQLGAAAAAPAARRDAHAALGRSLAVAVSTFQPLPFQPLAVWLALCALGSVVDAACRGAGGWLWGDGAQQVVPLPQEVTVCTQTKAAFPQHHARAAWLCWSRTVVVLQLGQMSCISLWDELLRGSEYGQLYLQRNTAYLQYILIHLSKVVLFTQAAGIENRSVSHFNYMSQAFWHLLQYSWNIIQASECYLTLVLHLLRGSADDVYLRRREAYWGVHRDIFGWSIASKNLHVSLESVKWKGEVFGTKYFFTSQ